MTRQEQRRLNTSVLAEPDLVVFPGTGIKLLMCLAFLLTAVAGKLKK